MKQALNVAVEAVIEDVRILGRYGPRAFQEQPVAHLHDVRLVDGCHRAPRVSPGVLEGVRICSGRLEAVTSVTRTLPDPYTCAQM